MPYVMVPVPEEHVEDVMQFVLREMTRASLEPWDAEAVAAFYHEIDEASRSMLAYAARAIAAGKEVSEQEAADRMQLRQRELAGIVRDLNERASKANRAALVSSRMSTEVLPNGRTTERRMLWMSAEVVPFVVEAERAELADLKQSLPGSP